MRSYPTPHGDYDEDELAVVVWASGDGSSRARRLETVTDGSSGDPVAFPVSEAARDRSLSGALVAATREDVFELIPGSDRSRPVMVPLPVARRALGWSSFAVRGGVA